MTETSRGITRLSGRINQTYGGPYHSSLILSEHHFFHAYKYLYRNPIEAGLAERVEDYPYSTLPGLLGSSPLSILVREDNALMEHSERTLTWLNSAYRPGHREAISRALRRTVFQLPRDRDLRRPSLLELELS
ncbi:MAG: hypothetical protein NDI61_08995 [Bdellovibrionaceae bacterium]|nr:hypothetical protein [Pseudobdellovibrionaceae bacterium]